MCVKTLRPKMCPSVSAMNQPRKGHPQECVYIYIHMLLLFPTAGNRFSCLKNRAPGHRQDQALHLIGRKVKQLDAAAIFWASENEFPNFCTSCKISSLQRQFKTAQLISMAKTSQLCMQQQVNPALFREEPASRGSLCSQCFRFSLRL